MKKILSIMFTVIAITGIVFTFARATAIVERGSQAFGGEMLILLIPVIAWIIYCNVKTTKQEFKDYKLTDEAEGADYISNSDCGGSIQITDINEISI